MGGGLGGQGLLLVGDSLTVVMDRRYLSFMYSYPNLIPLPRSGRTHCCKRAPVQVRPYLRARGTVAE